MEETDMRKPYESPALCCQEMQLGVFGTYGDGSGGNADDITPIKVVERLNMRME
jgi:hypothetical protein